jgi:preprotein translocase subunit SecA
MEEGVPIESRMISKRIEGAQKAVESQNFESRKHVLEYDDVMNKQREAVYSLRRQLMEGVAQKQLITEDYVSTILSGILDEHAPEKAHPEQWNTEQIFAQIYDIFGAKLEGQIDPTQLNRHELGDAIFDKLNERYNTKEQILGEVQLRYHERVVMLSVLDALWKEHLLNMDHLKEGIGLRGYGQKDPLVEYKQESFELFEAMMMRFQEDTARNLFRMQILAPDGTPIESLEDLTRLHLTPAAPPTQQRPPIEATNSSTNPNSNLNSNLGAPGLASETWDGQPQNSPAPPPTVPTRAPSTTIDALEREFQRNKQRDLAAAKQAGGSAATDATTQRRTGAEIGRNDPCFCGSGKKYKKCHGATA